MYPRTPVLRTGVADDHHVFGNPRIACDRVRLRRVRRRHAPDRLSRLRVDRHQPAVQRTDIDLAPVQRDASIDDVTTDEEGARPRHGRVIRPADVSRLRIERVDDAPRPGGVDDAVLNERRRLEAARGAELPAPHQAQLSDRLLVDLLQGAEPMVVVGPAVHQPVAGVTIGARQSCLVNGFGGLPCGNADQREYQNRRCEQRDTHLPLPLCPRRLANRQILSRRQRSRAQFGESSHERGSAAGTHVASLRTGAGPLISEGASNMADDWGLCMDCKWWQIEPEVKIRAAHTWTLHRRGSAAVSRARVRRQRVQPLHGWRAGSCARLEQRAANSEADAIMRLPAPPR